MFISLLLRISVFFYNFAFSSITSSYNRIQTPDAQETALIITFITIFTSSLFHYFFRLSLLYFCLYLIYHSLSSFPDTRSSRNYTCYYFYYNLYFIFLSLLLCVSLLYFSRYRHHLFISSFPQTRHREFQTQASTITPSWRSLYQVARLCKSWWVIAKAPVMGAAQHVICNLVRYLSRVNGFR